MTLKKYISLALLMIFVVSSFAGEAEARRKRHRRRSRAKRAPVINEKKLYERIGGSKRLGEIVDEWMRLNLADRRVAPVFAPFTAKPDRLNKERRNLNEQICDLADGPCQAQAEAARKSPEADLLILNESQFLVFGDNLLKSMVKFQVAEREKNEMLGRLGQAKADFVEDAKADSKGDSKGDGGDD